jgi:Na+-transporting methylmalonyl-CoA/oxaloacetate decarboxylase gamma subunit
MEEANLLAISVSSFAAVFSLLAFLAAVMWTLTRVFPEKAAKADPAMIAAVTTAVSTFYPETRITKVEEIE